MKTCHQRGSQLNDAKKGFEFFFGENNNYHRLGNENLQFDITLTKNAYLMEMVISMYLSG